MSIDLLVYYCFQLPKLHNRKFKNRWWFGFLLIQIIEAWLKKYNRIWSTKRDLQSYSGCIDSMFRIIEIAFIQILSIYRKPNICERWDNVKLAQQREEEEKEQTKSAAAKDFLGEQQIVDEIEIKQEIVLDPNE